MRLVLALFLLFAAAAGPVRAQDSADAAAIQLVIASQIKAFRQDDAASAYSYAAPNVKALFPTPEIFMEMVRTGYGAVYRPQAFDFGPLDSADGQWVQPVKLIGPDGSPLVAIYIMEKQPSGDWKIAGVYMLKGVGETA